MYRRTTSQQQSPPSELSLRTAEHMGEMRADVKHLQAVQRSHDRKFMQHEKRLTRLENPRAKWQDWLPWIWGIALLVAVILGKMSLADAIGLMGKG